MGFFFFFESVIALREKVSPVLVISAKTLRGKVSWRLGARNATKSHCTTNLTQEIYWERLKRVDASIWVRSNSEMGRR